MPDQPFVPLAGGCRCGGVRIRLEAAPIITHACHCRLCQKTAGTPFRVNSMIETEHLTVTAGEPATFHGKDSHQAWRCPECQGVLWSHHPHLGAAIAMVGIGVLDEGERLSLEAHYFIRSRHPWIVLPASVPAFETLGDPGKPGAAERIMAALQKSGRADAMKGWTQGAES